MNAIESFHVAALLCGFFTFLILALGRLTRRSQTPEDSHIMLGAASAGFSLTLVFLLLSCFIKP